MIIALYAAGFGSVRSHDLLLRSNGEMLELSHFVRLEAPERNRDFVRDLGVVGGIEGVSLIALDETAEA